MRGPLGEASSEEPWGIKDFQQEGFGRGARLLGWADKPLLSVPSVTSCKIIREAALGIPADSQTLSRQTVVRIFLQEVTEGMEGEVLFFRGGRGGRGGTRMKTPIDAQRAARQRGDRLVLG